MPVCPECSFWTPNFHDGDVDHNGTYVALRFFTLIQLRWFCNGCWKAWEDERREKRMTTGKLLPEDREVTYALIRSPLGDEDYDNELGLKLTVHERYRSDSDWFEADQNSLTVKTFFSTLSSSLTSAEDKPKVSQTCQASWYRSLDWEVSKDASEFCFDFSKAKVVIGSPHFPVKTLSELPYILFPQHIKSSMFKRFRALAREARRHRQKIHEIEEQKEREREELKRKQQAEIQQKQRDLVQLALKRAQNAAQTRKPPAVSSPPQAPKPSNVWSSAVAQPVSTPPPQSSWSSAGARPMMPPPVPVAWSMVMPPTQLSLQTALFNDPWSTAQNVWSSSGQPQAKKPRQPSDSSTNR
jgi:hypothetical protein